MQQLSTRSYQLFVGIDIANETFTAAVLSPGAKPNREPKSFEQTPAGFTRFHTFLLSQRLPPTRVLVVLEATGSYWIGLALFLAERDFAVSVINPAQAHYFAKAQLKYAKNDALDACTLAQLAQALLPPCWTPPPPIYHELQQRLTQRTSLLELRTQVSNQLHALCAHPSVVDSVRQRLLELLDVLKQQVAQIEAEIHQLVKIEPADEDEEVKELEKKWKRSIALLQTIPGIGLWSACWLVSATLNFTTCPTSEALVQYAGLAPVERTSGTSMRGRGLLRHHGHARIRTMLYLATLSATRYNPTIKIFYDRLRSAGKPKKVARCACARKLLHIAFAVVKREQPFSAEYLLQVNEVVNLG